LVYQVAFWHTGIIHGHFRHVWYSQYVWYTSCSWHTGLASVFSTSFLVSSGTVHWWHFCTFYIVQVIAQSTAEIKLLPVSNLTISPYSACHSALGCRISSKSVHPQWRYNVISIFKMAAAVAQFTSGFRSGDAAFFRMSVSISKPNFVVIPQSVAEI